MKTKFITCIYNNLYGTKFGGRIGREYHYLNSLKNIVENITYSDFVIYTSPNEFSNIKQEFTKYSNTVVKEYDLENHYYKKTFDQYKKYEDWSNSDRCLEIQYLKIFWMNEEVDYDYDYIYWIDAGLSYTGLFPNKYMKCKGDFKKGEDYYQTIDIFTNTLINNLNKYIGKGKIFFITKDNLQNFWSQQPLKLFDNHYDYKFHVIGGLFGGSTEVIYHLFSHFNLLIEEQIKEYGKIEWFEENLLTVILYKENSTFLKTKHFDTWWHEDNTVNYLVDKPVDVFLNENKSFYKIFEELLK